MKIVYKVVDAITHKSATANNECSLIYKIGKITKPEIPFSKIFCFATLNEARVFAYNDSLHRYHKGDVYKIFQCETDKFTKIKTRLPLGNKWDYILYWKRKHQHKPIDEYLCWYDIPNGTVVCDFVKPIKHIK